MANGQSNSSLLLPAVVFLVLAVLFWMWIRRDDSAADSARKSVENAEKSMRDAARHLKVPIQSETSENPAVKTAPAAMEPVSPVAVDTIPPVPPSIEPPTPPIIEPPSAPDIQPPRPPDIQPPAPPIIEPPKAPNTNPPVPPSIDPPAPPVIEPPSAPDIKPPTPPDIQPPKQAKSTKIAVEVGDVADDDDLTRIEGIGPRYRDILVAAGVKTFADLAGANETRLLDILKQAGARKPGSIGTWAKQAEMAAKGDWEALDTYQKTLTGGRAKE